VYWNVYIIFLYDWNEILFFKYNYFRSHIQIFNVWQLNKGGLGLKVIVYRAFAVVMVCTVVFCKYINYNIRFANLVTTSIQTWRYKAYATENKFNRLLVFRIAMVCAEVKNKISLNHKLSYYVRNHV